MSLCKKGNSIAWKSCVFFIQYNQGQNFNRRESMGTESCKTKFAHIWDSLRCSLYCQTVISTQCWKFPQVPQSKADNFGGGPGTFCWCFSLILCLRFEIQGMRTYNFFDWVSNTGTDFSSFETDIDPLIVSLVQYVCVTRDWSYVCQQIAQHLPRPNGAC